MKIMFTYFILNLANLVCVCVYIYIYIYIYIERERERERELHMMYSLRPILFVLFEKSNILREHHLLFCLPYKNV